MKKLAHQSIVLVIAALSCAAFGVGCVMDTTGPEQPSTVSTTPESNTAVHAPNGAVVVQSPVANEQIAPKINGALGPTSNVPAAVPGSPQLPRVIAGPDIDDPADPVSDGPRPHPWEPAPDDPNGEKPKIGGSEQSSSTTPSTSK